MRLWFTLLALILAQAANAVVVSRITDFEAGTVIEAEDVDDEFDNILSAINGNLNGTDNIVTAGIATANLATASVTRIKMGPLEQATSNSSLTSYFSSSTEVAIDGLSASITPAARPIWVGLQSIPGTQGRILVQHNGGGATDNASYINFLRDGATANMAAIGMRQSGAQTNYLSVPCSSFWFMDVNAGTGTSRTYTVRARIATLDSGMVRVENCQLVLFEL